MSNTDDNKTLVKLTNPKFTFAFADKEYQLRRANMGQMIQFQERTNELMRDEKMSPQVRDLEVLSYCVFLLLKEADSTVTEQFVKDNMPGNVDGLSVLSDLGFIDPSKLEIVRKAQERLTTLSFSQTSATEQGGPQSKSAA